MLKPIHESVDENTLEIGVDEAGRGPLFGRVYTASVILPKDENMFDFSKLKDSKKFHSKKKIQEVANYIKEHAISYSVNFEDNNSIDNINILQATQKSMHNSIGNIMGNLQTDKSFFILVDGNYFNYYSYYDKTKRKFINIPHECVKGGDNHYCSIAAASILAKVERDLYIEELCESNPDLITKYDLLKNKGYGTKKHMDGIKNYGITQWHRRSFAPCKQNYTGSNNNNKYTKLTIIDDDD